jgi:hypothetical protein
MTPAAWPLRLKSLALLAPLAALLVGAAPAPGPARYTDDGRLDFPADYREWIYLSSGLGMSYAENPAMAGEPTFDNVFVDPAAWAAFKRTGHWPNGSVFVLENRGATAKGSINKLGHYQSPEVTGLEVHVRDEARFTGGWGFYGFDGKGPAKLIAYTASCYACHQQHGAVDTTFTQFYPTARPIAEKAGTYLDR